jgi:hypothetical protein
MEDHKSPNFDYDKTTSTPSNKNNSTIELGDIEIRNQPQTEELDLDQTNPEEDDFGGYRIHDEGPESHRKIFLEQAFAEFLE